MKFFITEKPKSTQANRIINRFLWLPTYIEQVNNTKEYRWLEWIIVEQNRYMGYYGWGPWKDRRFIVNKKQQTNEIPL
jgi:hypothetical protein